MEFSGNTPLHEAVKSNESPNVADILIDNGANINAKNKNGKQYIFQLYFFLYIYILFINIK